MITVGYTLEFIRAYDKLPNALKEEVKGSIQSFRDRKNHQRLKVHKLHGKYKDFLASRWTENIGLCLNGYLKTKRYYIPSATTQSTTDTPLPRELYPRRERFHAFATAYFIRARLYSSRVMREA